MGDKNNSKGQDSFQVKKKKNPSANKKAQHKQLVELTTHPITLSPTLPTTL